MKFMRVFSLILLASAMLFSSATASEQSIAPKQERRTPIIVEYEGTDAIGAQLFNNLQKKIKEENTKTPSGDARFRILLSSSTEFPARPGVGSVFSATWTFAQSAGTLEFYLARDLGVVTPETIQNVVERILNRTEGVIARYGYLNREK